MQFHSHVSLGVRAAVNEYTSGWRHLTQEQVDAFGAVSGGTGRIHTDPAYARSTRFGAPLVQGLYLLALVEGCLVDLDPRWAEAGQLDVTFVGPVRVGEEFLIEVSHGARSFDVAVTTPEGPAITGSAGIRSD